MVRVLNIITNGLKREGITTTQLEYMRYIDKTNLVIDIAAVHDDLDEVISDFQIAGCEVIRFPDRQKTPFRYYCNLLKIMKKRKYDVVHVHGSSAIMAMELIIAKMTGVKKRIAHSRNTYCKSKKIDKIMRPIFYKSYTLALACGKEAGEFLFPNREFTVFHNGKDFSKFCFKSSIRDRVRNEFEFDDNTVVLGFVGRLNDQKNPYFLLDIFCKLCEKFNNYRLVMVGDGPFYRDVEQYINEKRLTDKIILTGRVDNVHELIQGFDMMLLPSLFEGLPNVVLEWQICGLPCIISDRVTKECQVTEDVKFLPIDNGADCWVDEIINTNPIIDREKSSLQACEKMRAAGFEIESSSQLLRKIYMGECDEKR